MGVYIKGMKMPKNDGDVLSIDIYPDGNVRLQYNYNLGTIATAIPVPYHGDLIDRSELEEDGEWDEKTDGFVGYSRRQIADAPVVIPAERSEE